MTKTLDELTRECDALRADLVNAEVLAEIEGNRALEFLRRARKAQTELAALRKELAALKDAQPVAQDDAYRMIDLLAWAYGKLSRLSFAAMEDALAMDEIKLLLMHPLYTAPQPQKQPLDRLHVSLHTVQPTGVFDQVYFRASTGETTGTTSGTDCSLPGDKISTAPRDTGWRDL